jgi:hypothetical protein
MMRAIAVLVALAAVAACNRAYVQQQDVPTPRTTTETAVAASAGRTWDALVDYVTVAKFSIKTSDRASGLLVTEPMSVPIARPTWRTAARSAQCRSIPRSRR